MDRSNMMNINQALAEWVSHGDPKFSAVLAQCQFEWLPESGTLQLHSPGEEILREVLIQCQPIGSRCVDVFTRIELCCAGVVRYSYPTALAVSFQKLSMPPDSPNSKT